MVRIFDNLLGDNGVEQAFPNVNLLEGRCVIRKENGPFMVFDSHDEFISFMLGCAESERLFHEVIVNGKQKLKFDIDGDIDKVTSLPIPGDARDKYKIIFATIRQAIIDCFYELYGISDILLIICASRSPDASKPPKKFSNHIIIPDYCVSSARQAAAFSTRVSDSIPEAFRQFLDLKVNTPNHNFRCVCSRKLDSDRVKEIVFPAKAKNNYADTLITNVSECEILHDIVDEQLAFAVPEKTIGDIPRILKLCEDSGILTGYKYRNASRGTLNFDRVSPSYCKICSRVHSSDNSLYVYVAEYPGKTIVRAGCRSFEKVPANKSLPFNKKTLLIAEFPNDLPGADSNMRQIDRMLTRALEDFNESSMDELESFPRDHPVAVRAEWNIYSEPEMAEFELAETLVVQAAMKMGKTKALKNYINKYYPVSTEETPIREQKICIISFRQTFTGAVSSSFPDFTVYSEVSGMLVQRRVIVQFESLHRLVVSSEPFDLLVLDESESIIEQMNSGLSKQFSVCLQKFEWLIRYTRQVICMDANITSRTLTMLQKMRPEKTKMESPAYSGRELDAIAHLSRGTTIHWNTYRNATEDTWYYYTCIGAWSYALRHHLRAGKRVSIPTSSLTEARGIREGIQAEFPKLRVHLYSSETTPGEKKMHFSDVNKYWSEYDVLIYTPTVSAGVSFEAKHYDAVFAYFTDHSCPAETQIQMIGRIRDVADHRYHVYVSAAQSNLPETIEDVRASLISSRRELIGVYADPGESSGFKKIPEPTDYSYTGAIINYTEDGRAEIAYVSPYFYVYAENKIARNRTKNNLCRALIGVVSKTGAKQVAMNSEIFEQLYGIPMMIEDEINEVIVRAEEKHSDAKKSARIEKAEEISIAPDIDELTAAGIQERILAQADLTPQEMRQYEKYKLRAIYNYSNDISSDFVLEYDQATPKRAYRNLCRLEGFDSVEAAIENIRETERRAYWRVASYPSDYEYIDLHRRHVYVMHSAAHYLIKTLGWKSLRDTYVLHAKIIAANVRENLQPYSEALAKCCAALDLGNWKITLAEDDRTLATTVMTKTNKVLREIYMVVIRKNKSDPNNFYLEWPHKLFSLDRADAEARKVPLVEPLGVHTDSL